MSAPREWWEEYTADRWWLAPTADVHDCDVADCGTARCDTCDERLSCLGPEPRACGVTCADCPCGCGSCIDQREDMRDELLNQLEREAR